MPSEQQREPADQGSARRGPTPLVFELFQGMNVSTPRTGVPEEQAAWLDGFMPLAPRQLRTLWGVGAAIYTASGNTIVWFAFYNIGATPYAVLFLSDGSAVQVNTNTGATATILVAGTIDNPSPTNVGITQYNSQYLIIVANQTDGYWVWDGSVIYTAGSLGPVVTLTNVGSGYFQQPTFTVSGGQGSGATFNAAIDNNGQITDIAITNAGSGWIGSDVAGTGVNQVQLAITGGNQAGSGAVLTVNSLVRVPGGSGGAINLTFTFRTGTLYIYDLTSAAIISGGHGYSRVVKGTISGGAQAAGGQGVVWANGNIPPTVTLQTTNGVLTSVSITNINPWECIGTAAIVFPALAVSDAGYWTIQSASNVTISSGGSLYGPNAKIKATGGSPPATKQALLTPVLGAGSAIVGVTIQDGGIYNSSTVPTLTVSDSSSNATATLTLMPFGIQGSCVQTYQGHVWVFNGANFNATAPGSVTDFATSDGGISQTSNSNSIKVGYTAAISTNGFLFAVGDSSMDYFSGVQTATTGGVPTTTFTFNNSDPEVGTPYPASVITVGQEILIANSSGIFLSSGGNFVKRSEMLDDVYNTLANFGGQQLSAAKATIFGKRVWMVLVPIIDPVSGLQVNKLFMFRDGGKLWWASEQDVALTFIAGQEINSTYTAWGTDGLSLYPLFQQPSSGFQKIAQTRLWDAPSGYDHEKSGVNIFALAQFLGTSDLDYTVTIDNEKGVPPVIEWFNSSNQPAIWVNDVPAFVPWSSANYIGTPTSAGWVNASGTAVQWTNSLAQLVLWFLTGRAFLAVLPPTAVGQQGVVLGMTMFTTADDMVLISLALQPEIVGYRA